MASILTTFKFPSLPLWATARSTHSAYLPTAAEAAAPEGNTLEVEINRFLPRLLNGFAGVKRRLLMGRIPFVGRFAFSKQVEILSLFIALLLLLTLGTFGLSMRDSGVNREQALISNEMQVLSQRIGSLSQQAVSGNQGAFKQLDDSRTRLVSEMALLSQGGEREGTDIPTPSKTETSLLNQIGESWHPLDEYVTRIYKQQQNLMQLRKNEDIVAKSGPKVLKLAQQLLKGAVDRSEDYRATAWTRQLYADVLNFDLLDAKSLLSTDQPNPQIALQLASNINIFQKTVNGLVDGNPEAGISPLQHPVNRDIAKELSKAVTELKTSVDGIVKNMRELAQAKQAARDISEGTQGLTEKIAALTNAYRASGSSWGGIATGVILTMFTLLGFALVAKVLLDDARARASKNEEENRRNEQAILRLLDDMSDLAEGDLTKHAKVTEDMTGAIADSVNYAIDELRSLVTQIHTAAGQLTESSTKGRAVSSHLLQVAEKQSNQIQEVTGTVLQMATEMHTVSESVSKCADVAEQSLAASGKGGGAVQDSIVGMNALREQIQDTSKRIKRLGESSQEIGEIVQLIAGITEQTHVLALNAAIQAAAAGEAGRGFSVVAEEVQRLAERSGEATKQIGTLVRTIQNDTQDAVAAMEKSTHGVVQGAQLADSAGKALAEIRDVSRRLAEFVASISSATLNQQEVAKQLAQRMQDILNITLQSTKGSKWTAESMVQISDLAQQLKTSVSGFKV